LRESLLPLLNQLKQLQEKAGVPDIIATINPQPENEAEFDVLELETSALALALALAFANRGATTPSNVVE
jgi:hypothetical protein